MKINSIEGLSELLFHNVNSDLLTRKRSIYKEISALALPTMKSQKRANFILLSNFESLIKYIRQSLYEIFMFNRIEIYKSSDKKIFLEMFEIFYSLSDLSGKKELTLLKAKKIYVQNLYPKINFNNIESIHGTKLINALRIISSYVKSTDKKLEKWIEENTVDRHLIAHGNDVILDVNMTLKKIDLGNITNTIENFYWIMNKFINKINIRIKDLY